MKEFFEGLVGLLLLPIMLLNLGAGVIGAIWLLANGDWQFVLGALAAVIVSRWIILIALLPATGLGLLGVMAIEREWRITTWMLSTISSLLTYTVMALWVVQPFLMVRFSVLDAQNLWPYLLVAYA